MSKEGYTASGIGLVALIGVVLQMMYPAIPLYVGWPIIGILAIWAGVLFKRGASKSHEKLETVREAPMVSLRPKTRLNWRDRNTVNNIEDKMVELHGHCDRRVIEAEMLRGVSANDLIRMNCTICFKPRGIKNDVDL